MCALVGLIGAGSCRVTARPLVHLPLRALRPPRAVLVRAAPAGDFQAELKPKDGGQSLKLSGVISVIGTGPGCALKLDSPGIAAEHAKLEKKSGRLFCTALVGEGDMMADTKTWVSAKP